ncbi:MAG: hypothetical protein DRI95_14270 [Bacteroidetes bacterium]|nr:MAG: hypothetical protein DRI95_14270 [Bacteroidota bacterium]
MGFSLAGGIATGDVPFDGYQSYGVRNNLRGYQTGKYKGKNMVALQTEYRRKIYKRWVAVAFAGTGSIWEMKIMVKNSSRGTGCLVLELALDT